MFYVLSKLLNFLLMPYSWLSVPLLIMLFIKSDKLRKIATGLFIFIFFFFSNSFISLKFMDRWEYPVSQSTPEPQYEYGIMLGGVTEYDSHIDRLEFNASSDRFIQTLDLYKKALLRRPGMSSKSGLCGWAVRCLWGCRIQLPCRAGRVNLLHESESHYSILSSWEYARALPPDGSLVEGRFHFIKTQRSADNQSTYPSRFCDWSVAVDDCRYWLVRLCGYMGARFSLYSISHCHYPWISSGWHS